MNSRTNVFRRAEAAAFLAAALCSAAAGAAETLDISGKGTYFVRRELLPLANGGAAVHVSATTVVSAEPSETGIMFGECAGLAYLGPGENAHYRSRIYCNFTENGDDSFTIEGDMSKDMGEVKVVGGSGRFQDASGAGTLHPLGEEDGRGRYRYQFRIAVP